MLHRIIPLIVGFLLRLAFCKKKKGFIVTAVLAAVTVICIIITLDINMDFMGPINTWCIHATVASLVAEVICIFIRKKNS